MPIHDQHWPGGRVRQAPPTPRLKHLGEPLVAVTATRPVTLSSGVAPARWRMIWNPGRGQMLGLEDEERRTYDASRIHHCDRSYPLLPALYLLPTTLVANADQSPRSLACADCETRLVHIVDL